MARARQACSTCQHVSCHALLARPDLSVLARAIADHALPTIHIYSGQPTRHAQSSHVMSTPRQCDIPGLVTPVLERPDPDPVDVPSLVFSYPAVPTGQADPPPALPFRLTLPNPCSPRPGDMPARVIPSPFDAPSQRAPSHCDQPSQPCPAPTTRQVFSYPRQIDAPLPKLDSQSHLR